MKIRSSFVSNSSSSSFLIYGIRIDDIDELIKKLSLSEDELQEIEDDGYYCLDGIIKERYDIEYLNAYEGENHYLGCSWSSIDDNETGKQFKDRITKTISEIMNEPTECKTIEESWYD